MVKIHYISGFRVMYEIYICFFNFKKYPGIVIILFEQVNVELTNINKTRWRVAQKISILQYFCIIFLKIHYLKKNIADNHLYWPDTSGDIVEVALLMKKGAPTEAIIKHFQCSKISNNCNIILSDNLWGYI